MSRSCDWPVLHKQKFRKCDKELASDRQNNQYRIGDLRYWLKVWTRERDRAERFGYQTNPASGEKRLEMKPRCRANAWAQVQKFRDKIREVCYNHGHFPIVTRNGTARKCALCDLCCDADETLQLDKVLYWNDDAGTMDYRTYHLHTK
jgi:hypothetical protein